MQINNGHQSVDVCVLGGGAVALTAVLLAQQQGLSVRHFLTAPTPTAHEAVPRTYAIAPRVQAGLAKLGIWDLLGESRMHVCQHMRVHWENDTHQQHAIDLNAADAGVSQLCSFVSEHDLLAAIDTAMTVSRSRALQIIHSPEDSPTVEHLKHGVRVTASGHTPVEAKLCIIAQGPNSVVAAQLNMAPTVYDYQHRAVVAVLHSDLSAPHTAWQWLGAHGQGHDVLALLPLPIANSAEARYGLVWSQPQAQAAQWVCNESAMLAAVQARCGHSAGQLSLHSAVQQFPLYRTQATQITQGNIVLLGDSAHKIHPLAGQGLNLGFEDAFTLFAVIAARENWRDLVDKRVLARYERQRASHVGAIDAVVHAIATRKHWPNSIQRALTAGLDISQQWPSLRQFVQSKVVQAMAA